MYLADELKVTSHPNYLHHRGRPVLAIWGMGFIEDQFIPKDPAVAKDVIQWFRSEAPARYRVTYIGGVPSSWRTCKNDSRTDPAWAEVYRSMDIVQPWTVGRYRDNDGADRWKQEMLVPDLALAARNGQIYMPVIFPGFSWHNLFNTSPKNWIPRNGGQFFWRQAYNAKTAGATALKIAMFDEVNEGTAVFKVASRRQDAPEQGDWLALDADGFRVPSDWYLRLAGDITRMFHGDMPPALAMPESPGSPRK
jgi:hypothetical protein